MRAAIDLQQHAGLRVPIAAAAMAGRATGMRRGDTTRSQDPTHTGTTQKDLMITGQELGNVGVITAGIALGYQRADLLTEIIGQSPGLGAIRVAMDDGWYTVPLVGGFEAPDLAFGHAQEERGFGGGTVASDQTRQHGQALLLAWGEEGRCIGSHVRYIAGEGAGGPVRRGHGTLAPGLTDFQISSSASP
jgi:hypothetical protein